MTVPIKLTICIPTLNRGSFIGDALSSIISQATEETEIVVVDGGSQDNTSEVISQYQKDFCRLRYFITKTDHDPDKPVSPSNKGYDYDCNRCIELAQGEYCWILPDDDKLKSGAIRTILNEIPHNYSLILVNAQLMSKDFSKVLDGNRLGINQNMKFEPHEFDAFFDQAVSFLSYVGGVVINRQLWLARNKKPYYGSAYIHVGIIFQAPLPGPTLLIAEPYVLIRHENAHWTNRAVEIIMFRWPQLLLSFDAISLSVRQKYQYRTVGQKIKKLIVLRSLGYYTVEDYHQWFSSDGGSSFWHNWAKGIAYMPVGLAQFIIACYSKIRGKKYF